MTATNNKVDDIRPCVRCKQTIFIVHTKPRGPVLRVPVDIEPISGMIVGLTFEHKGPGEWNETDTVKPWTKDLHATHHCKPPHRCKWCEQVHTQ